MTPTRIKKSESRLSITSERITDGIPSDNYYADNVCTLLKFVVDRYRDLLNMDELRFAKAVLNLSKDALRLYARILSRRGPIFLVGQFVYSEVVNVESAFKELELRALIKRNSKVPAELLCGKLTSSQLREIFKLQEFKGTKFGLISEIRETVVENNIVNRIQRKFPWFELDQTDRIATFSLLFFGDKYHDLSTFVIHDLGILRLEQYQLDMENRQFNTREEIDRYLERWALSEWLSERESVEDQLLIECIDQLESPHTNRTLERQRSKLLIRLGRELERRGKLLFALNAYQHSTLLPSRERRMRVYQRLGQSTEMEKLRREVLEQPWSIEEKLFAEKFKRIPTNLVLYNTKEQVLTEAVTDNIESVACRKYEAMGSKVWHLENQLPLALFGLVYWDWVYASVPEAFVNPFQIGPRDLYTPEFFETRKKVCVEPLKDTLALVQRLEQTFEQKHGISNPLINWKTFDQSVLQVVIRSMGEDSIRKLLQLITPDLRQMRSGFPDLFVVKPDDSFEFVEVKGPTDQVRLNQHIWLQALASVSLPVYVLKYKEPK